VLGERSAGGLENLSGERFGVCFSMLGQLRGASIDSVDGVAVGGVDRDVFALAAS
jgi:hypothetical protein